ncbi:alpha-hemoglobin-stabilizing protein [Heterocephalus glaber]|uniref:Alpha-hemoglobin-stabilizing protein n=1 Tax=Heterocephalus glaber TaxID=10181 RepID=A0AAX6PQ76_HETGA|nr:alpha-hemoglobin-stabilizing protein [Heterocephalus glaber]XP_004856318.1 alpha-hemoglobin-stabilizing protein [Heterocephalus glaber]
MALLQANKDLIALGMKEFSVLLNQQVFNYPLITEEDMVVVVDDWVNIYINYYRKRLTGEKQDQDRALQELRQELKTLASPFLAKYRACLESHEDLSNAVPSS